jgi:hypothetical protein
MINPKSLTVPTQLALVRDMVHAAGFPMNLPEDTLEHKGLWYRVRTGYKTGEATFWLEYVERSDSGTVVDGTYYRGDDLLSFLVNVPAKSPLKNLGKNLGKILDMLTDTP